MREGCSITSGQLRHPRPCFADCLVWKGQQCSTIHQSQRLKMNGIQISLYTACQNGAHFWNIKSMLDYATLPVASFYLQIDFRVWSLSFFALTHCKLVSAACFKWMQQTRVYNHEPKKVICSMHSYVLHTQQCRTYTPTDLLCRFGAVLTSSLKRTFACLRHHCVKHDLSGAVWEQLIAADLCLNSKTLQWFLISVSVITDQCSHCFCSESSQRA